MTVVVLAYLIASRFAANFQSSRKHIDYVEYTETQDFQVNVLNQVSPKREPEESKGDSMKKQLESSEERQNDTTADRSVEIEPSQSK